MIKAMIRKNFNDLYLVEIEHKWIHLDCVIITCAVGVVFGLIVGPILEAQIPEITINSLRLIGFTFAGGSLFWAWRIAAFLRRKVKKHLTKLKIRNSYKKGRDD